MFFQFIDVLNVFLYVVSFNDDIFSPNTLQREIYHLIIDLLGYFF